MNKPIDPPGPSSGGSREVPLAEALSERYLSYALSTIMSRSLPDIRDGLKPVHRRLLYAMRLLRLDPDSGYKKCARVVGDVIGKYHPHGDQAVYDALVRLAQDFAARYPLIDGQGNFGNVDGDNAAAMRYTESRLTRVAEAMLQGIDEDAVDFRPTYDGEESEPVVLPGAFPNLLANGASGIAVGMATNIPPHNAAEVIDAALLLLENPKTDLKALLKVMPGPDFPTGGIIVEDKAAIVEAYATGRGGFRTRARWHTEELSRGQYVIVVTEIPYQVQKSRLIENIAQLINDKKLGGQLEDVRDESTDEIRIVLEPRARTVDADVLMEGLFKRTDLENRFSLNMNILDARQTPRVMSLPDVLSGWLDHRRDVLLRRTAHRLAVIARRLEILEGYLVVYLNLDKVIRIIRDEDEPKPVLMKRFKLTELQAESVLNMRLRSLRKLEEIAIKKEHKNLKTEQGDLNALMKSRARQKTAIGRQLKELRDLFSPKTALGKRRTDFGDAPSVDVPELESMVPAEPITVICSEKGWIRALKGHVATDTDIKFKEGDGPRFAIPCTTTDKLLLFGSNGRFYTLAGDKLPGGRGHGEPVRLLVDLPEGDDVVALLPFVAGQKLLVASSDGRGFIAGADEALAQTRTGKQVLNLGGKARARVCRAAEGDHVATIGENRKLLLFPLADLPEMARGRGVTLQRYKDGGLSDAKTFVFKEGLTWASGDRTRTETELRDWLGKRAQAGRLPPRGFASNNRFD